MNNNNRPAESSAGLTLGDVYFVVFRHKWKIITIAIAGIVAAAVFYFSHPPLYESQAELFVRYITDTRSVSAPDNGSSMTTTRDVVGVGVINSEMEILRSFDLAQQVAATIGPEKILAKAGGGKDIITAAAVVRGGLQVEGSPYSSVISLVFQHPDPTVVQPVLNEIIAGYLTKHSEIHQALGTSDDFLAEETTQLRAQIAQTERELMAAKTNAGIIFLEDTKKSVAQQIAKIHEQLLEAELNLETRRATAGRDTPLSLRSQPATNAVAVVEIPDEQVDEYNRVCSRLAVLQKKNAEFMAQGYSEDSVVVKEVSAQITQTRNLRKNLEGKYPGLADVGASQLAATGESANPTDDGPAQLALLESKVRVLNMQLDRLRSEAAKVGEAEPKISDLQRKEDNQEHTLQFLQKSLDDARFSETLTAGKIANIQPIQKPTPPASAESKKRLKITGMLLAGGLVVAFGLAFLIELFLDRSIKRPVEIETKLKIPLFLSIPDVSRNGSRQRWSRAARAENGASKVAGMPTLEIAPWSTNHSLRSFYEALRDRIVVYFDVKNVIHNPKLVAVTSANRGAGVTTMAMGLAASLSETGEGNVLLVDMNAEQGAVQQFYKGKPGCHLDDAFEKEKRGGALMQSNLYVVSERSQGDKLPRILPKRFNTLLPKFKASDYDYIIFDMPPVTQTSVTPRLSGFMDMVLLVVEAEKTDQEVVRRANLLLKESKANVIAVLNKARKYVPERLHQEYLSDS
ncbi:MAG: Wzz/FepE/Etk N-terminal domain-containing protein [Verrucomicrobiota bacterium]